MRYRAKKGHFSRFNGARVYTRTRKAFKGVFGVVLLCGFIRSYFARVRGVVCLVVFRAFVRLWRRFRFSTWCGGAVVVSRSRRSSRVRARVYALASCIRAPACARPLCAREKQVRGCYHPFPRSKKFYRGKNVGGVVKKA